MQIGQFILQTTCKTYHANCSSYPETGHGKRQQILAIFPQGVSGKYRDEHNKSVR
ncbi:hypothetical protein [Sphingorhabdus sp.]|uniref:hypothetical protein n=1 Tax=Sphingorhabdus sp. TaxID=1902408 RepID=UPI00333FEAA0